MTSFTTYQKHVVPQATDRFVPFTHAVQGRVLGSATTIAKQVKDSRLPQAAVDPAFRKIARPRGAIMRRVLPADAPPPREVIARMNEGRLTAAPPAPEPTGQISLDKVAASTVPESWPDWLRAWLRNRLLTRVLLAGLGLFVILLLVTGLFILFGALLVVFVGALIAVRRFENVIDTAESFRETAFRPDAVDRIPPRPNFVLTEYEAPLPPPTAGSNSDSAEAQNFRVALKDAFNVHQSPPPPVAVPLPLDVNNAVAKLKQALNPSVAIPRRAEFLLKIPASIKGTYVKPIRTIVPVMAHPVFAEPMYAPLRDLSSEFLAPNLGLIPNNTISLLETNQRAIEAYMVGLNDEMGRELLWRQFPTDQRGSYFRQFWDVSDTVNRDPSKTPAQIEEELLDVVKLHTWDADSALGDHATRPLPTGAEPGESRLVLVIRGDLLKKYPTAVIYAQQARWAKDEQGRDIRELDDGNPAAFIKDPAFKAEIEPDIRFLGFDLTATVAKGNPDPHANNAGWFFVIQQRPGEPRFGLDNLSEESPERASNWNELAWEHLENFEALGSVDLNAPIRATITASPDNQFQWGRNAADMAYILFQVPVMVAFHAADMLS